MNQTKTTSLILAVALLFIAGNAIAKSAKESTPPAPPAVQEANKLMATNKFDEAERAFAEYLRTNPGDVSVRLLHADVLNRLNRFHFAADEAQLALKSQSQNADAHLLMGKIWQNMHEPAKAVAEYKLYLAASTDDGKKMQYATLISVLESEAKEQTEKLQAQRRTPGDYFNAVAAQGPPMRWKNADSIRVYIEDGKNVPGYRGEFEESLRQAFDEWTRSTEGKIAFKFVDNAGDAQMKVIWSDDMHAPALKAEAGHAQTRWGQDGIESSDISLLTVDPFKDGPIGKNHLYNVCLHEIGHALGVLAHSPYPEDIMAPSLYVQQGLSHRDINTMLTLYSSDSGKLSEDRPMVDEYNRPLTPAAKAERLAREGNAAAAAGQWQKAIDKLEAALALDPKNEMARKNIAVCANNLAVSADTPKETAIALLKKALKWDPASEVSKKNLELFVRDK